LTKLALHVPEPGELAFRQKLLSDPATMSYNKGYELGFAGYHNDTGCIDFPEEVWAAWYARWVNAGPERFYAYLRQRETGEFLGEVSLHQTEGPGVYEMGIVLHSAQRGKGYSKEGIRLLLDYAFGELGAKKVTNCFEPTRKAALNIHKAVGFQVAKEEEGLLRLELGRDAFRQLKSRGIEKVPVDSPRAVGRPSLPGSCVEIKL
jgi:RimJ/RimL family protein N-acetyltransferase